MSFAFKFPPMQEEVLPNGLRLLWIPDREQQGAIVALQVPAGEFADPPGCAGTADLVLHLMQKGCRSRPLEEFLHKFEYAGASLYADIGDEFSLIGCKMMSRWMDEILPLFWEMVCDPALKPQEFERLKKETVTALQAEMTEPSSIVERHFYAELAGRDHPLGRMPTMGTVRAVDRACIKKFFNDFIAPEGAVMVIAGDIGGEAARTKWSALFGAWRVGSRKAPVADAPAQPDAPRIRVLDKKDLTQVTIMLGHGVPGELDENRNELALANYILGGGNFSSRLMARVRSEFGGAYGIASHMENNVRFGTFSIATTTQNEQLGDVCAAVMNVYRDMSDNGVTEEELIKAKQFARGNMAFQLEGIPQVTEKLLWLRFLGRDNAYIEQFGETIAALDKKAVDRAIKMHLSGNCFTIAAVGNKERIVPVLESFGPVKVMPFRADP